MVITVDAVFDRVFKNDQGAQLAAVQARIVPDAGETDFDDHTSKSIFEWRMSNGGKFVGNERTNIPLKYLLEFFDNGIPSEVIDELGVRVSGGDDSIGKVIVSVWVDKEHHLHNVDPRVLDFVVKPLARVDKNNWARLRRRINGKSWFAEFSKRVMRARAEDRKLQPKKPTSVSQLLADSILPNEPIEPPQPILTPLQRAFKDNIPEMVFKSLPKTKEEFDAVRAEWLTCSEGVRACIIALPVEWWKDIVDDIVSLRLRTRDMNAALSREVWDATGPDVRWSTYERALRDPSMLGFTPTLEDLEAINVVAGISGFSFGDRENEALLGLKLLRAAGGVLSDKPPAFNSVFSAAERAKVRVILKHASKADLLDLVEHDAKGRGCQIADLIIRTRSVWHCDEVFDLLGVKFERTSID